MTNPVLEVIDVSKEFVNDRNKHEVTRAVQGVSFTISPGEVFGLVGESGSGKTTIARCAFGITPATGGQIKLFGEDIATLSSAQRKKSRKRLGFVFQDPVASLNPRMTIFEVISEGLIGASLSKEEIRSRVEYLIEKVGLTKEHLARKRHELSGGQCQRVAIARALASEPELILLDEPTSSLDLSVQAQILNLLEDLRKELNLSYLIISHNLEVIAHISDRMAVMSQGVIVEAGTTSQIMSNPQHEFTKTLIGAYETNSTSNLPDDFDWENWQSAPTNRWAYQHVSDFIKTQNINPAKTSTAPRTNKPHDSRLDQHEVALESLYTDALVVMNRGVLVDERYYGEMRPESAHLLQSVSKSLLGTLYGTLIEKKLIEPSRTVGAYLPQMIHSGYSTATIQNLLDMTAAVDFSEDYDDPNSQISQLDRASGWRISNSLDDLGIRKFLTTVKQNGVHGEQFQYCSANTDLLAWIAESALGKSYSEILSEYIWQPTGASQSASVTVDHEGHALANGGISTTARDLALFGQEILDTYLGKSSRLVSHAWAKSTFGGADPAIKSVDYLQAMHPGGSYHNQWWVTKSSHQEIYAVGIYGQYIWIDPATETVIVKFSTLPIALSTKFSEEHIALFRKISNLYS
jgi:6-aminohexanoate-oligomer exohydrolase